MRKAMILLFIIMLLCIGTALAEQSAAQRIYILDQSDSGSHSTGNDIGITHKGTQYYYDSDGNSRRKTMRSHGCSLYATIHAFQWLTGYSVSDSNVADTIRMFLQDANGGPEVLDWKNNENGHLTGIDFLKTYGVLPTSVSSSNKGQLANLFNQGGVAKYSYSYGNSSHFALAVGMIDDDLDGDGAVETWIHIVDSAAYFSFGTLNMGWACRSFNSHRQLSLSELSFNNNRSENNYSGLEYWMRYDLFKNCTISYGLIPGHIYIGRAIPDGNYIIGCEGEPSLFLDIKGNDYPATNSTGVFVGGQLTGNDAFDKTITWTVKYEGDGYYSIKQFKTDMALSVYSEMVVYQNYGTDTQLWSIIPDGENGYRIRSKCNGYYLDVKSGYPNWGSDVQLSAMRSTRAQGWIFTRAYGYDRTIPDGNYLICCEGEPSLFLDVKGNDYPATNSTGVFVGGQLTGNDAFDKTITWTVKYEDDGYYSIKQFKTDMALSVYSEMVVYQDYGTKTQRWAIIPDDENGYRLQAKCNDYYLDVKSGYPNWGSDVQLSAIRSTRAQGWVFTRAYGYDQTIPDGNYLICCEGEPSLFLDVKGNDYPATNSTGVFVGGQLTGNDAFDKTITWTVKYHEDDGYYSIKQYNTDMALSVYSDMVVYQDYGTKTQRWAIISDGENGYRLQAKYNDFYLDVKSGYPNWGSDVQLSAMRSTSAQGWVFIPSEHVQTGLVVTPSNELLSLMSIKNKDELDTQTAYYSVHIREHIKVEVIYDDGLSEEVNDYDVATWIEHSDDKPLVYGYDFKVAYGDLSDTSEINITLNPLPVYRQPDFSLPAAIITVDESAFEGIAATIVYIPDTCTSIGKWAFKDCTKLTQIRIPANCAIGTDAFSGCVNVLIFSTKGSAAETYANSHANCTFVAE